MGKFDVPQTDAAAFAGFPEPAPMGTRAAEPEVVGLPEPSPADTQSNPRGLGRAFVQMEQEDSAVIERLGHELRQTKQELAGALTEIERQRRLAGGHITDIHRLESDNRQLKEELASERSRTAFLEAELAESQDSVSAIIDVANRTEKLRDK